MKISDLPWWEKPDVKLDRKGVEVLNDSELLAIIVGKTEKGVMESCSRLLSKYNLNKLEDLSINELSNEIGRVGALKILSLIELTKRYNKLIKGGYSVKVINSAKDIYNMFVDEYRNYKKEVLNIVLLDSKNKVIKVKEISVGTLNNSLVHPREVFKEAIKESANSIILVHNHPSGDPRPSQEDIEMTKKLIEVGKILQLNILDHIIVGKNRYWNWLDSQS